MGLDMYLSKKYHIKNWDFLEKKDRHTITLTKGGKPSLIPADKITDVITEVMTWRKANAIHNWFVNNVQEGVDDCHEYYVPKEKLTELLSIVNEIIKNHSKAPELLPTSEGFFFGDTSYDDYYFSDLEETQKILSVALLSEKNEQNFGGDFYYQSSW
jgi:hypothetical protein|tara:strand:+ start:4772 stop:5242 length:471 start_codon:yes stop_codon:yes gene_type:complete